MRAAWYDTQGPAHDVLRVTEMELPHPACGDVRIRVAASGVNPGDVKKRQDAFGYGMPFPRIIPHSDGAGVVDQVGDDVPPTWLGQRVWCYGAQTYRPFGTAAEYTTVPVSQISVLPSGISFDQGACLGIPSLTAHRAVTVHGSVSGRVVLVQGGAGAVGSFAVQLARRAGATVIATVRHDADGEIALRHGAHHVVTTGSQLVRDVQDLAPGGIDHVVEVSFAANLAIDLALLKVGGSIATYATGGTDPAIPFWPLAFKNVRVSFLGSDDFPPAAKRDAADAITQALRDGWVGPGIAERFPLDAIADAHAHVELPASPGRVIVVV